MSKALATKNVAAVLVGASLILGSVFAFATPAKADTLSTLQAQVQALLAQIAAMQGGSSTSSTGGTTTASASCHTFTRNQKLGDTGGEVMWIQQFLNSSPDTMIAATGAGSKGNETSHFGPGTKKAIAKFQVKYAADILTPVGLTKGTGSWGPSTRAKANALCSSTGGTTGGTTTGGTTGGTTTPTGPGITVAASTQPSNSLAPSGAVRVPFTTFTLTNNTSAAVTVNGVTVQRSGLAQDNNFSGVVLVDQNGLQVGVSHTFDSNHTTMVGDTFTLQPGATQTFTVAGNIAGNTTAHSGEVATLTVTGVNTSVPVAGSLPITGASQTINTTLNIGTVTASNSSFDPNGATTKHIGDTSIKFSGVRFTAGSGEDLKFYSIRWRVNGSVSPTDLANVVTYVNGTSYPTVVSADGRYYTSSFPGGIMLQKGNSADVYVQGDIVGTNASGRQAEFDIDKTYDVYFVGQTYGYGVGLGASAFGAYSTSMPHGTGASTTNQPWFSGSTVTVQGGSVTTIQNATSVTSQNIAVNVPNTVLGGFQTNFAGEPVTVQGMTFNVTTSGVGGTDQITLVSVVDENGAVVAGPVDASAGVLTFTNSVTFKTGLHTYTLKGKIPTSYVNGGTVQLSTNPSTWTSPQGQQTGNQVSLSGVTNFTMNTMTVRGATLAVAASQTPSSQSIVAGGQNILFANIQLDASQSGEDVQLSSFPLFLTTTDGTAAAGSAVGFLSACQMWDGTTALNTGSDVKNTLVGGAGSTNTITFTNGSLKIAKGTVKTLGVTCNLSSTATSGTYAFGVSGSPTVIGVNSGVNVSPTVVVGNSGTMTISGGAKVTVAIDPSSPSYAVQSGGTTGVAVGVIKLRASNEAFNLTKLGLTLLSSATGKSGSGNSSNAASDLTQVYLYSGATLLGTATFTGSSVNATSTLSQPFMVARDVDTQITIKADLATIGVSAPGGVGDTVKVDPASFEGTGVSSGTTIRTNPTVGNTVTPGVAGVRLFKTTPTLALDTLPTTGVADGRLMHFKISASTAGPIGVNQFTFTSAWSNGGPVTNVSLYGFTDQSYSQPISGQSPGGLINASVVNPSSGVAFSLTSSTTPIQIPAGQTYYFELRGSVAGVVSGTSVVTTLNGDGSLPVVTAGYQTNNVAGLSASKFIWSGNSTTTAATSDVDWSNGYSLPGLPSSGLIQTRSN